MIPTLLVNPRSQFTLERGFSIDMFFSLFSFDGREGKKALLPTPSSPILFLAIFDLLRITFFFLKKKKKKKNHFPLFLISPFFFPLFPLARLPSSLSLYPPQQTSAYMLKPPQNQTNHFLTFFSSLISSLSLYSFQQSQFSC